MLSTMQFGDDSERPEGYNGRTFFSPMRVNPSANTSSRTFFASRGDLMRNQRYQGNSDLSPGIGQQQLPFPGTGKVMRTDDNPTLF